MCAWVCCFVPRVVVEYQEAAYIEKWVENGGEDPAPASPPPGPRRGGINFDDDDADLSWPDDADMSIPPQVLVPSSRYSLV